MKSGLWVIGQMTELGGLDGGDGLRVCRGKFSGYAGFRDVFLNFYRGNIIKIDISGLLSPIVFNIKIIDVHELFTYIFYHIKHRLTLPHHISTFL